MNLALAGFTLLTLVTPASALAQQTAPDAARTAEDRAAAAAADTKAAAKDAAAAAEQAARDGAAAAGAAYEGAKQGAKDAARDTAGAVGEAARDVGAATASAARDAGATAERAAERGGSFLLGVFIWLLFGLAIGALAKLLMPGKDGGGLLATSLLGIAGAFVGGLIAAVLGIAAPTEVTLASFVVPIAGAMLLLLLYRMLRPA
jgi:uncharacterized membrane protein YeaQ/YmgE (transglycosylase-associated protein family)